MSLLDELKEKRQDAIENVAAEDLDIEATNLTLAEHQRVRAFWVAQIADLDKAISALTPEGKEALLESQPEPIPTEVRKQDEQDAAGDWTNGGEDRLDAVCAELLAAPPPAQEAPAIPEGFIPWSGGECPVDLGPNIPEVALKNGYVGPFEYWMGWGHNGEPSDIIGYRIIAPPEPHALTTFGQHEEMLGAGFEPLGHPEDASMEVAVEQTEHDRPKLTNEEYESLEKIDGVLDAEPSPILRSEVPPAAETYLAPSGDEFATVNGQTHLIVSDEAEAQGQAETQPQAAYAPIHNEDEPAAVHPDAAFWAKALPAEAEAKAEEQKFNPFRLFGGAKKTLVGEGV